MNARRKKSIVNIGLLIGVLFFTSLDLIHPCFHDHADDTYEMFVSPNVPAGARTDYTRNVSYSEDDSCFCPVCSGSFMAVSEIAGYIELVTNNAASSLIASASVMSAQFFTADSRAPPRS